MDIYEKNFYVSRIVLSSQDTSEQDSVPTLDGSQFNSRDN